MLKFVVPMIAAIALATSSVAQTPTTPQPAEPSVAAKIKEKIERKEDKLEAKVKGKWSKKKQKVAACRQQAKDQKLHGVKKWKFITKCSI